MKRPLAALCLALLAVSSCGRPPRPAALAQADQVRRAPAVESAAAFAPQMLAHAESLRRKADDAYEQGDVATSGILAERALVAYQRAAVLARLARAKTNAAQAERTVEQAAEEQRLLNAEKQRLEADIASLEQLIQVVRDAQPITPSPAGDHGREMARLKAARSIVVDARMLCAAAKLLDEPIGDLEEAQAEVQRLEELLAKWPKPAPIDDTLRVRARCLSLLTLARRTTAQDSAPADIVLAELSKHPDLHPIRDDRGIVVTLRGDIRNTDAQGKLSTLVATAGKFSQFPILVVSHTRAKAPRNADQAARERATAVVDALRAAGIDQARIHSFHAGPHRPVVPDPVPPPRDSKNDRVEIVLVAPSS